MAGDALVIGGGLAGLGAAYELTKQGFSPVVLEREPVPGGRALTRPWGDARVECGAMFVAAGYRRVMALLDELGMSDDVEPATRGFPVALRYGDGWRYIDYFQPWSLRHVVQLRDVPKLMTGAIRLGWPALRSVRSLVRADCGDTSTFAALDGRTVADALGPAGVRLGALADCMLGYREADLSVGVGAAFGAVVAVGAARGAGFQPMVLASGTGALTAELASRVKVEYGVTVDNVRLRDGRVLVAAHRDDGPVAYDVDAVVLATPADVTTRIWPEAHPKSAEFLRSVRYTATRAVYLRLREPHLHSMPDGRRVYCELIPSDQRGHLRGLGVLPMDWLVPSGGMVLTGVVPDDRDDPLWAISDEELADLMEREAIELHPDLRGQVVDRQVVNLERYVPVYGPGYLRRLADLRRREVPGPIDLAGDYLGSPTLEGALASGQRAAARSSTYLSGVRPV